MVRYGQNFRSSWRPTATPTHDIDTHPAMTAVPPPVYLAAHHSYQRDREAFHVYF